MVVEIFSILSLPPRAFNKSVMSKSIKEEVCKVVLVVFFNLLALFRA
jgi:hypothetical protein